MRKECTYVQHECDDKFFCDFEFTNEYYLIFSGGYGKIYEETINNKFRYRILKNLQCMSK